MTHKSKITTAKLPLPPHLYSVTTLTSKTTMLSYISCGTVNWWYPWYTEIIAILKRGISFWTTVYVERANR